MDTLIDVDFIYDVVQVNISFKALSKALNLKEGIEITDIFVSRERSHLVKIVLNASPPHGGKVSAGDTRPIQSIEQLQKN